MSHCHTRGDKIVVIKDEKSSSFKINNPNQKELEICNVDGGLVCDSSRRCDKSVRSEGEWIALIELKGRDVESATEQLFETFCHKNIVEKLESKRVAIVVSKVVKIPKFDYFLKKQKQRFAKNHRSLFRIERDGSGLCLESIFK